MKSGVSPRLCFEYGRRFLALLVSLLLCAPVQGQQTQQPLAPASDLAEQNYSRVAASPQHIRAVLEKQPGLMVELKRWAAREATDRGQVVAQHELSDEAIFDRLGNDLEFRVAATRLLQRYGYLVPTLNPDSELAKETELLRQQRVELLRHQRALELTRAQEQERLDRQDREALTRAEGTARRQRRSSGSSAPLADYSAERAAMQPPLIQPPLGRSPSLIPIEPGIPAGSLERISTEIPPPILSTSGGNERLAAEFARRDQRAEEEEETVRTRPTKRSSSSEGRSSLDAQDEGPEVLEAPLEHRPNPFEGIPSLYEMYRRVSPRRGPLARFGEEVFRNADPEADQLPMDLPVGPDYVLGPGDGLAVDIWGSVSLRLRRTVDREGRISLPEVGPVLVSGRTLGEVQNAVQQVLRTQFRDVSADVSLSRLRTVRVYVVGDVESPGGYDISSLSTPLNALFAAGGPTGRGSLRVLRHYRGKRLVQEVDVYDLLLRGVRGDVQRLENGDTVLVPPVGGQVTVEGAVRRPAVYELRTEKSLADVLGLAGGILPTASLRRIQVQRVEAHQKRTMLSLDIPESPDQETATKQLHSFEVRDRDEINVSSIAPYNPDAVYLEGHVLRPGRYSHREGMKLTDLVSSYADLLPEPAAQYAEIIRLNLPDYRPSVESVDLAAALANPAAAPVLQPMDTVRIFSRYDFEEAPVVQVGGEVRRPGVYRTSGQIHLRDALHLAGGLTPNVQWENAQVFRHLPEGKLKILSVNLRAALEGDPLHNILLQPRDRILVHRNAAQVDPPTVTVRGEVDKPGRFPLTTNMRVADLINMAGGLKRSAYTETADLTRFVPGSPPDHFGEHQEINIAGAFAGDLDHNIPLGDGDTLTIRQLPGWQDIGAAVDVRGEVQHPGVYGIRPGERLSSVLKRVGGFLDTAYAQAAILERVEVRELQEKSKQNLIQRIEQDAANVKVAISTSAGEQVALQQAALQQRQRVLESVRATPVTGRLVIRLNRNLAEFEKSPYDIEMRAGDRLHIPKHPNFVVVTGQVYNSNAVTYLPRKNAGWYVQKAGGLTNLAERGAIFIIRANGEVVSGNSRGWWAGGVLSTRIEPGDTIVVPEKPIGGSPFWRNFLTVAQLLTSTSVAVAVFRR